jgi:hypothetical protein
MLVPPKSIVVSKNYCRGRRSLPTVKRVLCRCFIRMQYAGRHVSLLVLLLGDLCEVGHRKNQLSTSDGLVVSVCLNLETSGGKDADVHVGRFELTIVNGEGTK